MHITYELVAVQKSDWECFLKTQPGQLCRVNSVSCLRMIAVNCFHEYGFENSSSTERCHALKNG